MGQEAKFRGKSINSGKWLCGYLGEVKVKILQSTYSEKVIFENLGWFNTDNFGYVVNDCTVDENTIGQFTGKIDKNKKEIFSGDLLKDQGGFIYKIWYSDNTAAFMAEIINQNNDMVDILGGYDTERCFEVIGNIYDNKELLNKE